MASHEPTTLVVCDAGPLIHLDELGCLDLLNDFDEVCVPEAVWQEVFRHRPSALHRRSVPLHRIDLIPEPTEGLTLIIRTFGLHQGEEEALRLLEQFPSATLLTDDLAARHAAQQLNFPVSGTLGLLLRAVRRNLRTRQHVLSIVRAIPQESTLFVNQRLLNWVIEQVQHAS